MNTYIDRLFKNNVELASHTTFRIGGPARWFYAAHTAEDVVNAVHAALECGVPYLVIGEGSNILVSDAGVEKAIIAFRSDTPPHNEGETVAVSGGAPLDGLVEFCVERGLEGLENLSGIPGTIGGAIAGNAGAYGSCTADMLCSVDLMESCGTRMTAFAADLRFGYRHSSIRERHDVVLAARFRLRRADAVGLRARRMEVLRDRASKHPDYRTYPTAGSFFKNLPPPPGGTRRIAAGGLLEAVGAKDLRVGGAAAWPRHANIVVNWGDATACEVMALAEEMKRRVRERFAIELEREVMYLA